MISTKLEYITVGDFEAYTGISMEQLGQGKINPSNYGEMFLKKIEIRVKTYLESEFGINFDALYSKLNDNRKEHYKYALLEQALYVIKNTDIATDSGYDPDYGIRASSTALNRITMAPECIRHLKISTLWNLKIKRGDGYNDWLY